MPENNTAQVVTYAAAIVAILLWILTRAWEIFAGFRTRRRIKSSVLRSLLSEVKYNTRDLEVFVQNPPDMDQLRLKLEDKKFVPYITDARHTSIYHANISHLHHMEDSLIQDLISFYGGLADIRSQIDGVLMPSYKTISVEGQVTAIQRLIDSCTECSQCGQHIIANMQTTYPDLSLARRDDGQPP